MKAETICIGLLAHVDAGKTTLSESILLNTGTIRKAGRVDHGDSFLDHNKEERERGITIFSKQALFALEDRAFTLIDTPGHVDFSAEMERTLSVLDYAVLIISAPDGIHGHDITLWKLLKSYRVPVFVFVNKMDQPGADRKKVLKALENRFGSGFVGFSDADGSRIDAECLEQMAMLDEAVMEDYLEHGTVEKEQIAALIRERKLFPCCFGSALKNEGVREFLAVLSAYAETGEYPEAFGARVFKITRDAKGNRLAHIKLTGGELKPKDMVRIHGAAQEETEEKADQILLFNGTGYEQLKRAAAGSVVAVTGLSSANAGSLLGAADAQESVHLVPLFTSGITAPFDVDIHRLYLKLKELEEEIPEIALSFDEKNKAIHAKLMGEVQTEILKSLVKERFGIDIGFTESHILYKETITKPVIGAGHYEPLKHYSEVHLLLEPGEPGSGIEIASDLSEDILPQHFQRLILTHVAEKKHLGVLIGSEITDIRVTLINGKDHAKHTEGGDFRESTYRAIRQGLMKAMDQGACRILEPYYHFELTVPENATGRAMTDLSQLAEKFDGPELKDGEAVFTGRAAVSAMQGYAAKVLAYTGGFGRLNVSFGGYGSCRDEEAVMLRNYYDPESDLANPSGSVFCAHGAGYYVPWNETDAYLHLDLRAECEHYLGTRRLRGESHAAELYAEYNGGTTENRSSQNARPANGALAAGKGTKGGKQDYLGAGIAQDKELEAIFASSLGRNINHSKQEELRNRDRMQRSAPPAGKKEKPQPEHVSIPDPKRQYLLVDGYNIIFAWEELNEIAQLNIDSARTLLMDILSNYQGFRGMTLILVFDAYKVKGGQGSVEKYHNIYVVYTKEAQTADAYIEKTVHEIGKNRRVTVATNDALEQTIVFGEGAVRMSARELKAEVEQCNIDIRQNHLGKTVRLENRIGLDS